MRQTPARLTVGRLMVAVAASAIVCALLAAADVAPNPGFAHGAASCFALAAIACLAGDSRDLASAFVAVGCGILVGSVTLDPCTPVGIVAGPIAGYLARIATRRRPKLPCREPDGKCVG